MIENRTGGGTNVANEMVARAEPDGHTVLMGGPSLATTRGLNRFLSFDPIGDFAPVAFLCSYSFFMFVPNSLPVKSVKEFIAYAKANPASSRSRRRAPDLHRICAASCSSTWLGWI